VRYRDLCQDLQRWIVQHITFRQAGLEMLASIQDPAVTMIGVFAQADIGHHDHLRDFLFDGADGLLDNSVLCKVFKPDRIFFFRNSEENHSLHICLQRGFRFTDSFFQRQLVYPRHRADFIPPSPVSDK
jgi:hypothetical protein